MKPMIRFSWLALILEGFVHSATANETFKFDASRSTIGFSTQFSGTIDLDRQHPEASSVSARIQVSSINTGIKKRDDHLRSAEFFNVAKFPELTFKSRSVKQTGTQSGDIMGDLTMHGITKPVTLHIKLVTPLTNEARTRWEVTTDSLKRRDFGLMFGSATETVSGISQEVAIRIEIEAVKSR